LKIAILTKEFPPNIYGGAGVHVDYLTRELTRLNQGGHEIRVLCFGAPQGDDFGRKVIGIPAGLTLAVQDDRHGKLLDALFRDVAMVGALDQADILHCHTWYTHLAGCLLKQILQVPMVLTTHSLEPHRPWKREQLGAAYHASSWLEKTAYQNADAVIAVSGSMAKDVHRLYGVPKEKIQVIPNGIDATQYRPKHDPGVLARYGIDPLTPFVLMVGRITRQKGILHFLESVKVLAPGIQCVVCASVPDTYQFMGEVTQKFEEVRRESGKTVVWVRETVPVEHLIVLYSHASVFLCPSVYEPFGIINLEAMACGTAVVATAVGGIPEVVTDGETGLLIPLEPAGPHDPEPKDPKLFARQLASAVNDLLADPRKLQAMGRAARKRVEERFCWAVVAQRTLDLYKRLASRDRT